MGKLSSKNSEANDDYFGESLLIEDHPVQVLPKLAVAIGLSEAIVLQQVFWLFKNKSNGKVLNGHRWIFNSYDRWRDQYFPWWSTDTIQRVFAQLERMHILVTCQPEGTLSRRKYYRLNEGMVVRLRRGTVKIPRGSRSKSTRKFRSSQVAMIDTASCDVPLSETSPARDYEVEKEPFISSTEILVKSPEWAEGA